jgi:large subunit ribosomal protein L22
MPIPTAVTNTPQARAILRHHRQAAFKVREVLDLVRGKSVEEARGILRFTERGPAEVVLKLVNSAAANAENNLGIPDDELFVAACYADEGPTVKRWRPRARGRATRIRKRTCHVTLIVARYTEDELERLRRSETTTQADRRRRLRRRREQEAAEKHTRKVAAREDAAAGDHDHDHDHDDAAAEADAEAGEATKAVSLGKASDEDDDGDGEIENSIIEAGDDAGPGEGDAEGAQASPPGSGDADEES